MNISKALALPDSQYKKETTAKTGIVLHFTAGSTAKGAVDAWKADPVEVATAYVVDRDGTVYETFPPEYWGWHLGLQGKYQQNGAVDRRTVGIEIVNMGPLVQHGGQMCSWPKNFTQPYCEVEETERYWQSDKPYRGYKAFVPFTQPQYDVLPGLIDMLVARFGIPRQFLPKSMRLDYCPDVATKFNGITTHVNYRQDKTDIGPAFLWYTVDGSTAAAPLPSPKA